MRGIERNRVFQRHHDARGVAAFQVFTSRTRGVPLLAFALVDDLAFQFR